MAATACWYCSESIRSSYNYCGDCGAPVDSFRPTPGEGFLSRDSDKYLAKIMKGEIKYSSDPKIDSDLEESLHEQLRNDIKSAVIELGAICIADEDLLLRSIDFDPILELAEGDEDAFDELPPSFLGFVRLIDYLVTELPESFFEIFGEVNNSKSE